MRVMQTMACVVLLTAAVAHGRSIDNPAEDSSPRPVVQKALAKVEQKARSIPSPVQVSSGLLLVKGNSENEGRNGRSFTIDESGIPVIDGVRSPDDNSPIHRNARIINNILVLPEDEAKFAKLNSVLVTSSNIHHPDSKVPAATLSQGDVDIISKSALVTQSKVHYPDRQARVLNRGVSKSTNSQNRQGRFFPSESNQVVSYSYLASPENTVPPVSSASQAFGTRDSSKSVIYGTGVAAKPSGFSSNSNVGVPFSTSVSKSVSSSINFVPSNKDTQTINKGTFVNLKPSSILQDSKSSQSSPAKQSTHVSSNSIQHFSAPAPARASAPAPAAAISRAPQSAVYNHQQSQASAPVPAAAPAPAPFFNHAPSSGHSINNQVAGGEFTIHQKTFQAHPGAPTFNIPIPIPTSQLPHNVNPIGSPQRPISQNQIQQHFDSIQQQYAQPQPSAHQFAAASESFHRVTHQHPTGHQATAPHYETQHSVLPERSAYEMMLEPFRNIGTSMSKAFETLGNSVRRGYSSLQIPERMNNVANTVRKSSMNDYIQRTVSDENLPLVAGAAVLGSLGLLATAIAVSNANITLGKRSIGDPAEEFLFQMVDEFIEPTLFDQLEEYTSWADSQCSKRVFCDVVSLVSDDYIYTLEKRMGMFLDMIDHGKEEMSIKKAAADVMDAVRRRECVRFNCGDQIDSVVIPKNSSGPR